MKNGIVYVVSADAYLYAIDALTGEKRWAFDTLAGMHQMAKRHPSEPVKQGGVIYVTNWPFHQMRAPHKSYLYAIDVDSGLPKWTFSVDGNGITKPTIASDAVFFSVYSEKEPLARLSAVDAVSGKMKWEFQAERGYSQHSPAMVASNIVYFATDKGLFALEPNTGNKRWSFSSGDEISINFQVDDRFVYVVDHERSVMGVKDTLHALDLSTGQERWSYTPGGIFGGSRIWINALHDGVLYMTGRVHLDAIDAATGKKLWSFKTGTSISSKTLMFNGMIFVTSQTTTTLGQEPDQGYLYAIDAKTGKLRP